jgi:hypothetical protein
LESAFTSGEEQMKSGLIANLRLRGKLVLLSVVFTLGFLGLGGYSLYMISTICVPLGD